MAVSVTWLAPTAEAAAKVRVVPTHAYPTIQSAVQAAHAGDTIKVLPGVYREQVVIDKNLRITGSGAGETTIRAPGTLVPGEDGNGSIVEIGHGASVRMSRISVSGPGAGTCDDPLEAGIRVLDGSHLDLRLARVIHIRNSPTVACFHQGVGILVGVPTDPASGSAVIRNSQISDYATKGILILSAGPATIRDDLVAGSPQLAADGIDALFSTSVISHNIVTQNVCPPGNTECGTDLLNDVQHAGILAGGIPGATVTHNVLLGNQVGLFALPGVAIDHNIARNNALYGIWLGDGDFVTSHDLIVGGVGGILVSAIFANSHALLKGDVIAGTSGQPVQTFECCGFTATVDRTP